jgi:hypothetical protein
MTVLGTAGRASESAARSDGETTFDALDGEPVGMVREQVREFGGTPLATLIGGGKSAPDRAALYNASDRGPRADIGQLLCDDAPAVAGSSAQRWLADLIEVVAEPSDPSA